MKKQYTKKQIQEAINYWTKQLKLMESSNTSEISRLRHKLESIIEEQLDNGQVLGCAYEELNKERITEDEVNVEYIESDIIDITETGGSFIIHYVMDNLQFNFERNDTWYEPGAPAQWDEGAIEYATAAYEQIYKKYIELARKFNVIINITDAQFKSDVDKFKITLEEFDEYNNSPVHFGNTTVIQTPAKKNKRYQFNKYNDDDQESAEDPAYIKVSIKMDFMFGPGF